MEASIQQIGDQVKQVRELIQDIFKEMGKVIVGQHYLVERLLIGLLSDGHVLLEGVPGLAKTLSVRTLSEIIDAKFQRIQFTPDLLPADVIGTRWFITPKREPLPQSKVLFLQTLSWRMKLIERRPKFRVHSWRPCRNIR